MAGKQKVVVVGAGPVGSLAALYAAQRGHDVEIYELRPALFRLGRRCRVAGDPPSPTTICAEAVMWMRLIRLLAFDRCISLNWGRINFIDDKPGHSQTQLNTTDTRNVDLRDPTTELLNFTRSINLALSERGINAMRNAGQPKLLEHVFGATIPMRGRMIHGRTPKGELYEASQDYDIHGRAIYAVDRAGLNKRMLDILEEMPNVKFFFSHKLTGADFKKCKAWFEVMTSESATGRAREIEIDFDFMIGADGAHSAVRYHMMKFAHMDYTQEYIDTLWCEFQIKPAEPPYKDSVGPHFRISPNHLHIWPGKDFMFIAIPSDDGSFTCTLFLPNEQTAALESSPDSLPAFFDKHFPGVTNLIPANDLIESFKRNPHLPLISIKCSPHHFQSSAVLVGDAAHAMVPFYGQGMNAGLEDVRVLFSVLDKHRVLDENNNPSGEGSDASTIAYHRTVAFAEYTANRVPDAHSINDLALQNYVEMRASVLSPRYRLRKWLEEAMSVYLPGLGWQTKYSRVSFGNERYSEVVAKSDHQGHVLMKSFEALVCSPFVVGAVYLWWKRPQCVMGVVQGVLKSLLRATEKA